MGLSTVMRFITVYWCNYCFWWVRSLFPVAFLNGISSMSQRMLVEVLSRSNHTNTIQNAFISNTGKSNHISNIPRDAIIVQNKSNHITLVSIMSINTNSWNHHSNNITDKMIVTLPNLYISITWALITMTEKVYPWNINMCTSTMISESNSCLQYNYSYYGHSNIFIALYLCYLNNGYLNITLSITLTTMGISSNNKLTIIYKSTYDIFINLPY